MRVKHKVRKSHPVGEKVYMSNKRKDLLVIGASGNYDPPMTDAELWVAVGRALARRRVDHEHKSELAIATAPQRANQPKPPDVNTIRKLERGQVKTIASLSSYCAALGIKLSEVLASVLPTAQVSAEAMEVALSFDAVKEAAPSAQTIVKETLKLARSQAKQGGDGQVAPGKRPSRTERAR